jgi:hypothetical protein
MYLNQLTIIGFTGQDDDFHFSSNGILVTTLSVATNADSETKPGGFHEYFNEYRGHTGLRGQSPEPNVATEPASFDSDNGRRNDYRGLYQTPIAA